MFKVSFFLNGMASSPMIDRGEPTAGHVRCQAEVDDLGRKAKWTSLAEKSGPEYDPKSDVCHLVQLRLRLRRAMISYYKSKRR